MWRIARGLIAVASGVVAAAACNTDLPGDDQVIDVSRTQSMCCAQCDTQQLCVTCSGQCTALDYDGVTCQGSDEFFSCPAPPGSCPALSLFIPNVMTPNGDGINDLWVVADANGGTGYTYASTFLLQIYSRWGGPTVYTAEGWSGVNDPYIPGGRITWDGRNDAGQLVDAWTYYYGLTLTDCAGTQFFYKGTISVMY